jgi:hypothetical protein
MLVTSSLDILWLSLAFVILWIGICLGFCAFYFMLAIRDARQIITSAKKKLELIDQIISIVRKRVESTASYVPPLIEGAEKLMEAFREKRKATKAKAKSKKK